MSPLLSICIPTYNRAGFLAEAIASVLDQGGADVEITVSDNASTDGTWDELEALAARHPCLRIRRWETNQGADRNYLQCVEMATGTYCLILGSDDVLLPGSLEAIRAILRSEGPDILLFNRRTCTRDMRPIKDERFLEGAGGLTFDLAEPGGLAAYLGRARSLCAAFSYLSSVVFRKAAWDAVPTDEGMIGSAYVHTQKLLGAAVRGPRLRYLDQPLVACRLGFDSFREHGLARRVLLDLDGYEKIMRTWVAPAAPDSIPHLRRLVRQEYPFGRVLRYQGVTAGDPAWAEAVRKLEGDYGYPALPLRLATFLGRSRALVDLAFWLRDLRDRLQGVR